MTRVLKTFENREYYRKLGFKLPKTECPTLKTASIALLYKYISAFDLGIITEALLCQSQPITYDLFDSMVRKVCDTHLDVKLKTHKQIQRYLEYVNDTHTIFHQQIQSPVEYQKELRRENCEIIGHPDAWTKHDIFEIKTTRQLKKSWKSFLCQLFSYAALSPNTIRVHLVLPLQKHIWSYNLQSWNKREEFWKLMSQYRPLSMEQKMLNISLRLHYPIGDHILKEKTWTHTLMKQIQKGELKQPYQIMFSQSTKLNVDETDLSNLKDLIYNFNMRLYIHSPYLLNLCMEPGAHDDYVVQCMKTHLEYGKKIGCQGVVIHVGKQCKREEQVAWNNMVHNIKKCIEYATEDCPVLLETPAGQGTEMLRNINTFMNFVESIHDPRLQICVDTCHVFACGHCPFNYLNTICSNQKWKSYLKLVHFNDSYGTCGSCIDRHAVLGQGIIPHPILSQCAELCFVNGIDMLME